MGPHVYLLLQENHWGTHAIGVFDHLEAAMECPVCVPNVPDHWHALNGPHQWKEDHSNGIRKWTLQESNCTILEMELRSS